MRLVKPLALVVFAVNIAIAALWMTVLHPATSQQVGKAAEVTTDRGPSPNSPPAGTISSQALLVGPMFLAQENDCPVQTTSSSIRAVDGRRVAQLVSVPTKFSQSVSTAFPPCPGARPSAPIPEHPSSLAGVSFQVLGVVRYQGSGGIVLVSAARPSAAALQRTLDLGAASGSLPDGSKVYTETGFSPLHQVRWMKDGLIITVGSDDLSSDELQALAASVVVK